MPAQRIDYQKALHHLDEVRMNSSKVDEKCWNSAIDACGKCHQYETAARLLIAMKASGAVPSLITYHALADSYARVGMWQEVLSIIAGLKEEG